MRATPPAHAARGIWQPLALAAMIVSLSASAVAEPPAPGEMRVAQLRDHDAPPDGYMIIVAYGHHGEVDRWSGAIDHRVRKPTRYAARRQRDGRWTWNPRPPGPLRINAPDRNSTSDGQFVTTWAEEHRGTRVLVIVVPHPGEPDDDASRTGLGVRGQGRGQTRAVAARKSSLATRSARQTTETISFRPTSAPTTSAQTTSAQATSAQATSAQTTADETDIGQGQTGDGPGQGRSAGQSVRGTGTHQTGSTRGSTLGGHSPSWIDNPRAELAIRGGRTPADGGRAGGSAGGKKGGTGHVSGSGWLNLIDVPENVAPAVAAAMIVFEADIMGFGQRLFSRTVRGLARSVIHTEIGQQARAVVKRRAQQARARMTRTRPDKPPAEHLDEIMDYVPDEVEKAFYRDLAGLAKKRSHIYRATRARTKDATEGASQWAHKLAVENEAAWRKIQQACEQRLRAAHGATRTRRPAGIPGSARGSASATRSATTTSRSATSGATAGASVRTPTAVSRPAHTISRGGGLGPVLKGLRGEARVRAVYNIGPRKAIEIHGRKRIPDGVTDRVLTEVKNVKKLSFTRQLRDYLAISEEHGLRFDLFVRRDTELTGTLQEAVDQNLITLRYIP